MSNVRPHTTVGGGVMHKPSVVFVVGHSNWGKSKTLRALTNDNYRVHRTTISGVEYFVRRMSNDDLPESFIKWMTTVQPEKWPDILAALCPDFDDPEKETADVLQALKDKGYRLFFWVLHKKFGANEFVQSSEISRLRTFGKVEVVNDEWEASVRGRKFKAFIASTQ
jgi:hypothetical protein